MITFNINPTPEPEPGDEDEFTRQLIEAMTKPINESD